MSEYVVMENRRKKKDNMITLNENEKTRYSRSSKISEECSNGNASSLRVSMVRPKRIERTSNFAEKSYLSYNELRKIEKTRRNLLIAVELPLFKLLFKWKGTCLRIIATDPLLWISVGIYVVLRVFSLYGLPKVLEGLAVGASGNISVVGGFLSFFLVYYVVESSKRFEQQYDLCMQAKGAVLDIASLARAYCPRDRGLRIVRYMNASYAAGFVGLSDSYSYKNYFLEINKSMILLTDAELDRVERCQMDQGGSCYREIVQWVQIEIKDLLDSGILDKHTAKQFRHKLLGFQSNISALYNFADQPIIFFYIHFICLVSTLYLPLFALNSAHMVASFFGEESPPFWTADIVAGCVVLLQAIFVIGLRILGQKLSDPFGTDFEDLSVMYYVKFTYTHSGRIMGAEPPTPLEQSLVSEDEIVLNRASIGRAWDIRVKTVDKIIHDDHFSESIQNEGLGETKVSSCIIT